MEHEPQAIAALERVLLTVEAELMALHSGASLDTPALEQRLAAQLTEPTPAVVGGPSSLPPPPPPTPAPTPAAPVAASAPAGPPAPPGPTGPGVPPPPTPPRPAGPPPPASASPSPRPGPSPVSGNGSTLEWLFRVGGIALVVMAAVFFVSTAISRGWIGPTAQLVLATGTSLALIAQSFRFPVERRPWSVTLAAGGAAAFFVSGVVGHLGLDLLSTGAALGWLSVAVLGFLGLARAHDSELLASFGAPAAGAGVLLLSASADATVAMVLAVGIGWSLALAATTAGRGWFGARLIGALVGGSVILAAVSGLVADHGATIGVVAASVLGIGAMLWLSMQQLREYQPEALAAPAALLANLEARLAAATIPWIAFVAGILVAAPDSIDAFAWTAVGVGAIGMVVASVAGSRIHPTMRMLHQLAGIGTAVVGCVVVLDGPALLAALLVQAVVTGALALKTRSPEMVSGAALLASVVAIWTAAIVVDGFAGNGLSTANLLVTGLVVAVALAGGWSLRNSTSVGGAWILTWIAALTWVASAWQRVPQDQMWISISWALLSVGLLANRAIWTGELQLERFRSAVHVGLATLAVTGAKLIFVDLVAVDVLWRAGLFLIVGGLFLRLAFVLPGLLERADGAPTR